MSDVDLVKRQPDDDEPSGELQLRPPGDVELYDGTPTAREQLARVVIIGWARVVDGNTVTRARAITRQAPRAGARLVIWTPRGARRGVELARDWLFATHAAAHVARLADTDHPEWAKAAGQLDNTHARLATRRWAVGVATGLALMAALAWWAPTVFAGFLGLAVIAGVGALVLPVTRAPGERAASTVAALGLGWLAWFLGPDLAALVPRPPGWAWWVLGGVAIVGCGLLGRRDDQHLVDMPANMAPPEPLAITAPMVCQALVDSIPKVKDVDQIRLLMDVARDDQGYTVDLELPPGIPATEVIENREEFAAAMRRELGTVWPEVGTRHPGHLACFFGHKPMATAAQAEWGVATGGKISLFESHPLFTNRRGQWVRQTLAYTSWVIGAVPRMGKTRALLSFGLLAAFDVTAKLYVWDLKGTGDLSSLAKVAHYYDSGDEPEQIESALVVLRRLRQEMRERAASVKALTLEQNPEKGKVTAALASLDPERFGLRIVLVDEVQVWLQEWTEALPGQFWEGKRPKDPGKEVREEFLRLLRDLVKRGPALGIIVVLATQKPDAQSIPSAIADNVTGRLCLKVNGQVSNDQVLGTSSYRDGIRATQFAFADKGVAYLRGDGADAQVVRTVAMEPTRADEVADRARALRLVHGGLSGQSTDVEDAVIVTDIVADVERVLRERSRPDAWWEELVPWLAELRPEDYEQLTEDELSARMRARGIKVSQIKRRGVNHRGVRLVDLRERDLGEDA